MLNVNTSLLSTVSMEDAISGMQYVSLDPDVVIDANETMAEINAIANNINTKITKIEDYDQAKEHLEQILSVAVNAIIGSVASSKAVIAYISLCISKY